MEPQLVVFLSMEDYPRTLSELEVRFSTQESCLAYLSMLRWPGGVYLSTMRRYEVLEGASNV